jgi:hypothetical protein
MALKTIRSVLSGDMSSSDMATELNYFKSYKNNTKKYGLN